MKIKLYGVLADLAHQNEIDIDAAAHAGGLRAAVLGKFPAFSACNFQVAVNRKKATDETRLHEHDEIVLLPPFAGG